MGSETWTRVSQRIERLKILHLSNFIKSAIRHHLALFNLHILFGLCVSLMNYGFLNEIQYNNAKTQASFKMYLYGMGIFIFLCLYVVIFSFDVV